MRILLPLVFLMGTVFYTNTASAQSLKNIKAQVNGDEVTVTYDLEAPDKEQKFKVELYSSHDNYRNPLRFIMGDHGENITPGNNKKIIWNAKDELNSFKGNLTFEVRASAVMPSISFTNPTAGTKFKRGKVYTVAWQGGDSGEDHKLQLFRNGVVSQTIGQAGADRKSVWAVPDNIKPGGGYTIRLVNGSEELASSKEFSIGRKIPLMMKVVPVFVVGVVVYLLIPPPEKQLPGPPEPTSE